MRIVTDLIASRYEVLQLAVKSLSDCGIAIHETGGELPLRSLCPYTYLLVKGLEGPPFPALMFNYGVNAFPIETHPFAYTLQLKTQGGNFALNLAGLCENVDGILMLPSAQIPFVSAVIREWISSARRVNSLFDAVTN